MSTSDVFKIYRRLFKSEPPEDFIRAYAILSEAIYFGTTKVEDTGSPIKRGRKHVGEHWPLHEWRLLPAKSEVDKALAQIAKALSRFEQGGG